MNHSKILLQGQVQCITQLRKDFQQRFPTNVHSSARKYSFLLWFQNYKIQFCNLQPKAYANPTVQNFPSAFPNNFLLVVHPRHLPPESPNIFSNKPLSRPKILSIPIFSCAFLRLDKEQLHLMFLRLRVRLEELFLSFLEAMIYFFLLGLNRICPRFRHAL